MSFISVEIERNLIYLLQYCILSNRYMSFAQIYYLASAKNSSGLYYTPCFTYERLIKIPPYNIKVTCVKKILSREIC